ncbi:MAG TPA: hypothetical protein PKE16_00905, partial [Hyphomicrobium sp.]|nr:hypothetical protein [Hyphomicrobium sp.]
MSLPTSPDGTFRNDEAPRNRIYNSETVLPQSQHGDYQFCDKRTAGERQWVAGNVGVLKAESTTVQRSAYAFAIRMFCGAVLLGACAAIFYYINPRFDLVVSDRLYVSPHRFIGNE